MNVLLIDAENINGESFVFEAYRLIERNFGHVHRCTAFGAKLHLQYLSKAERLLGLRLFETKYSVKNQADKVLINHAMSLASRPKKPNLIAIASGDGDFFKTALWLRSVGIATACLSRRNILNKLAENHYDVCHALDPKCMNIQTREQRMIAILDCLHELTTGDSIGLDDAVRRMRKWRIAAKGVAGTAALNGISDAFDIYEAGDRKFLRLASLDASHREPLRP